MQLKQINQASTIWNKAKQIIETLTNEDEQQKMQYILYQRSMTSKELTIFYTFALYLREKQYASLKIKTQLNSLIDDFVKKIK
tara:strand:+ start:78 stop:326 length:249 start_codon:yes stop_codon:yes gene_type:complete